MTELFGLSGFVIAQIKEVFARHNQIETAVLYGSRAKGNDRPGSDIDLTLIGELTVLELMEITEELDSLPLPYQFDLSLLAQLENPELISHIERVGQVFYEKGS